VQKRPQEILAAVPLPADTGEPSSSETQNPETSLGIESDSEETDDSSKDDYKTSDSRMKHFKRTVQQISLLPELSADPRNSVTKKPWKSAKGNCVKQQPLQTGAGTF
jgi:hypothetical protein